MLTAANPTGMWETAETIRLCIMDDLTASASQGAPNRSCVVWGDVAWDECRCGQLTVAIGRHFPTTASPSESTGQRRQSKCGFPILGVTLSAMLLRCAPVQGDDGTPPSCQDISDSAMWAAEDAWRVRNATVCCVRDLEQDDAIYDWAVVDQAPVGPMGACVGSRLTVNVFFQHVCSCSEGS